MGQTDSRIHYERNSAGYSLAWTSAGHVREPERLVELTHPFLLETAEPGKLTVNGVRHPAPYQEGDTLNGMTVGRSEAAVSGARYRLEDRWNQVDESVWRVDRSLEISPGKGDSGFRLLLEFKPTANLGLFDDFRYFAPPALYDPNDLDEDGIEDYLETRSLSFRENRLNALTLLAYHAGRRLGIVLCRADVPEFDPRPNRIRGQGLLISWWFGDDPTFSDTGFGGRGKGEENKTSLSWIAAIAVYAHHELL